MLSIIEELQDYGFPVYDEKNSYEREKCWKVVPGNSYRINNLATKPSFSRAYKA